MDKTGLVNAVHEALKEQNLNFTKEQVGAIINTTLEVISNALKNGDSVKLKNFGVFQIVTRASRTVTPPGTGKPITVPERKTIKFRVSDKLKTAVE